MKRRLFVGSLVAGLLGFKTSAQTSQQTEFSVVITGRVLNEKGEPVAKFDAHFSSLVIRGVKPPSDPRAPPYAPANSLPARPPQAVVMRPARWS